MYSTLVLPALFNYTATLILYGMPTIRSVGIIGKFSVSSNHGIRIMNIKNPLLLSRVDPRFPVGVCANPDGEAPRYKFARLPKNWMKLRKFCSGMGVLWGCPLGSTTDCVMWIYTGHWRIKRGTCMRPYLLGPIFFICIQLNNWLNNRLPLLLWKILDPSLQFNVKVDRLVANPRGGGRAAPTDQKFLDLM